MSEKYRRLAKVKVSNEILAELFKLDGTQKIKISGLPKDAKILRVSSELYWDQDATGIIFESEEFSPVAEGTSFPELNLEISSVKDEDPTLKRGREFI